MFICTAKSNDIQVIQVERRKYSSINQYFDATYSSPGTCDWGLVGRSQNLQLEAEKHTRWLRPQQTLMTRIYAMIKLTTGVQRPAGLKHLYIIEPKPAISSLPSCHITPQFPSPRSTMSRLPWTPPLWLKLSQCTDTLRQVFKNAGWDQNWVVRSSSVGCHITKSYEQ